MDISPVTPHRRSRMGILPMFLIGAGLLVLGFAALFFLPKPGQNNFGEEEFSAIPVEANFPAPQLTLTNLQGDRVSLSDYAGQVVLVNNWATWCPPCRAEMPTLQAYYEKHQADGFVLIAIDAGDPKTEVDRFVNEAALTFPVWLDPDSAALNAIRNDALPNSWVIDRDGAVRLVWTGAISAEVLEKYVTPMLED